MRGRRYMPAACRLVPGATFSMQPAAHLSPLHCFLFAPLRRRYLEIDSGLVLTAGSLAVRHLGSDTHMHINAATAAALELIHPIRVGTCSARRSGMSLFRCGGDAAVFVGAASSGPGSMAVAFCAYFKLARRALWVLAKSCRMRQRCKPTHTALHTARTQHTLLHRVASGCNPDAPLQQRWRVSRR